jgi:hypothetical protein
MNDLAFQGLVRRELSPPILNRQTINANASIGVTVLAAVIALPPGRLIQLVNVAALVQAGVIATGEDFAWLSVALESDTSSRTISLAHAVSNGAVVGTNTPALACNWSGEIVTGTVAGDSVILAGRLSTAAFSLTNIDLSIAWYDLGQLSYTNFVDN